jgi:integrase
VARKALNNPRQLRSKLCGCTLCKAAYPLPERPGRRDCKGTWQARFRDQDGVQRSKNFTTKAAAVAFLDETRTSVRQGTYLDPRGGGITVGQWWDIWWPTQEKKGRITTRARKRSCWTAHIKPAWEHRQLGSLGYIELQDWLSGLSGHATQTKVLGVLRALFSAAVRDRRLPFSPAAELEVTAEPTAKHPSDLRPPTEAQYELIREHLPVWYRPLADFLQETGMRFGEATGLRRCNVDLEAGIAEVREVIADDEGVLVRQGAPKTRAGFRTVPLTEKAKEAVRTMYARLDPAETRTDVTSGMHPEELIFRGPHAGEVVKTRQAQGETVVRSGVLSRANFRRVWIKAIKAAGVARLVRNEGTGRMEYWPRVHDYRGALGRRLHAAGVPERETQLVLGQERGGRVTWLYQQGQEEGIEIVRHAMEASPRRLRAVG